MAAAAVASSTSASTIVPNRPQTTSPFQFFHAHAAAPAPLRRPRSRSRRNHLVCSLDATKQAVQEEQPAAVNGAAGRTDCYGVFCTTYDLRADEETKTWKKVVRVAVSGAAGMISNHLLFKLASGEVFGPDQPIALKLLGSSQRSFQNLEGVAMELEDSLYPLLREVSIGTDPYEVFQDVEWALLIGAKPRGPGMERAELLSINGQIFAQQGKALNAVASRNVKVLVVGNPCNTKYVNRSLLFGCRKIHSPLLLELNMLLNLLFDDSALICLKNAPDIPPKNFHALTRLDENRAKCQLALKAGVFYDKI
ncbi:unnamed protein product [Urochloa humidicola]